MSYLRFISVILNNGVYLKRTFLILKYNKIVLKYLQFFLEEGFFLRIVYLSKNTLQVYLKYINGIAVFRHTNVIKKQRKNFYLSVKQILNLSKRYPVFLFIFYVNNCFLSLKNMLSRNIGGSLFSFIV